METRPLLDKGITLGGKPLEHSQMVKDHYEALRFTLQYLNKNTTLALLQIIEDRYTKRSLIITSQLPVAKWYDYLD